MQLKKRIVSLALAAMLLVSVPISAFATTKFNQGVFDGRDDLRISTDIMTGETSVVPTALDDGQMIIPVLDAGAIITVQPGIFLDDSKDTFILMFDYLGGDWAKLNGIIIKIGDNRYSFTNCYSSRSIDDGFASEYVAFYMKDQTAGMMKDLAEHRDDEITVRLTGSAKSIDFVLTDTVKTHYLICMICILLAVVCVAATCIKFPSLIKCTLKRTENGLLATLSQLFLILPLGIHPPIFNLSGRPAKRRVWQELYYLFINERIVFYDSTCNL